MSGGRGHREPSCRLITTICNGVSLELIHLQVKVTRIFHTSPALALITDYTFQTLKSLPLSAAFLGIPGEVATLPHGTLLLPSVAAAVLHQALY